MQKYYQLRIPEPCHEDWNKMTPSDKGRFCSSCSKTVVDFTVMNNDEIQKFLQLNADQKLCGHVRKSQLNRLKVTIPATVLQQSWLGHRAFLLALLITMGTTLMSCKDDLGNHQKIDEVTVVDSFNQGDDLIEGEIMMGMLPQSPITDGLIISKNDSYPINKVDFVPQFKETPQGLSQQEQEEYFQEQLSNLIKRNFNKDLLNDLTKSKRANILFTITDHGYINDIRVFEENQVLAKELKRTILLIPRLIPAKKDEQNVAVNYSLPIIFSQK